MEHRCSSRVPVNAQVRLFKQNKPVGTGVVINANPEGILVAWHGRSFRRGTHLAVQFLSNPSLGAEPIPALVVHHTGGLGLLLHTHTNLADSLQH
jgi:hypothetical protein